MTVGLGAGCAVHIIFRNVPGDMGVDYVVTGSEVAEPITVAGLDGNFVGPALSWPELVETAQRHTASLSPAARLLLLLPALGDVDMPPEALRLVEAAVTAVGARGHQDTVAEELLSAHRRFWGVCVWREHDGLRVCDGAHSVRNPSSPPERLLALSRAFSSA